MSSTPSDAPPAVMEHDHEPADAIDPLTALVTALQDLCDDQWLRDRDRMIPLTGTRPIRSSPAITVERLAHQVRALIKDQPGYNPGATTKSYLAWFSHGMDTPDEGGDQ